MKAFKFKSLLFAASLAFAISSCNNTKTQSDELDTDIVKNGSSANSVNKEDMPIIKFEKETHDFGRIKEGEKVSFAFKFKNIGKSDLLITDAKGSCGCTVPNYPTKPISPGEEGIIDVTFDSSGKSGKQNKTVTLLTNCEPATKILTVMGEIEAIAEKK